ncbi:MAG: acetate kinase, partial [Thermomicrobiales bacterium]
MEDVILVLNAGSSSIKFQLFAPGVEVRSKIKGQMEGIGVRPRMSVKGARRENLVDQTWPAASVPNMRAAIELIIEFLKGLSGALPVAIGHRVVHGGLRYREPVLVDEVVLSNLEQLSSLAPLHQPNSTALIRFAMDRLPQIPQVACFDTAF